MSGSASKYPPGWKGLRRQWAPAVAAGLVSCWRCGKRIMPGEPWDLGHDDRDRRIVRGPEHRHENRATSPRRAGRVVSRAW